MGAKRSVRAKENICRAVGPGRETESLYVSVFIPAISIMSLKCFLIVLSDSLEENKFAALR